MKTLTIKLTAPLQSYGNEATFERRTTNDYPTKSAIIGMIAAALGYRRTDERIAKLNELSFAVRLDQVGTILTDYQTVEWKQNTRKITYREYLQDAVFVVAIGSEDDQLIEVISYALHHPQFPLALGRRSNAPAGVLKTKLFSDVSPVSVLQQLTWQAAAWYQKRPHRAGLNIIADADLVAEKQNSTLVKDRVVSFDQQNRRYGFRAIAKVEVKLTDLEGSEVPEPQASGFETQHNPMENL